MADSTTQVNDAIKRDESTASIERNDPETSAERGEELEDFAMSSSDEETDANEPQLDAAMMNELLLVCSNLGMLRVQTEGEPPMLMRGENCTEWIHDLQRAIRRDHAKYKLVAKQLGKWKILQKKLLPLLVNHQHDLTLVLSILKVLVMLTMKPSRESTNIALQLKYLRHYKHEFLRYGVISIMMTILLDPLSRKRPRTDQDYLYIEIVLTLIRNLLAIPNEDPRFVTSTTSFFSHLQEDLICTLHEESVYEMILLFAQDIDSPESRDWNLLIMEILCLTLESSQPKSVVSFTKKELMSGTNSCLNDQQSALTRSSLTIEKKIPTQHDLLAKLDDEKKASAMPQSRSRRHSNFGGVLTIVGPTGRTSVLSDFSKAMYDQVPQAAKKPISRKRGQKSTSSTTDFHEIFGGKGRVTESDERTMRVLREICDSIVAKSYAQLTNSLKTEFRRGSNKLISTDRLQYFYLVWFLTTYHRLRIQMLKSHYKHQLKIIQKKTKESQNALGVTPTPHVAIEKPSYDEKAVLSTLDMFSFNFVLQSIENYATMKNYHGMTVSVQLLTEMMAYLAELTASDDSRLQRIADSLQHKIFYERDFLDRIPVLLKTWSPGLFPKAYVVDVVTLTHLVFKVLDSQGSIKVLSRRKAYLSKKGQKKIDDESKNEEEADGSSTDEEESERHTQLLMEMQRKEADFDVRRYFLSMVSGDTVRMYTSLLAEYRDNSSKVNHYIHSFFYRTKHFQIYQQEKWTMQPMLFNIHVLLVFNKMLHDTYIQRLPEYTTFLDFIRGVVCDFFALADKNNLLLVEVFLRQTYPSKSCMLIQRCYDPIDSMSKSRSKAVALGKDKQIEALNESRRQRIALDHEDLEGETEFQFSLEPSDFRSSSLVDKDDKEDKSETEYIGVKPDLNASVNLGIANTKTQRKAIMSRAATERAKNWSKVEDRYLAKVYMKFCHLPSVYEVISYEDMFQERDRTPDQIERRVKYLKLHRKTHDSSDEDDNKISDSVGDDFGDVEKKSVRESRLEKDLATLDTAHPRRRLRRGARLSDEESDDEIFLGREADPSLVTSKTTSEVTKAVNGALNATSDPKDDVETQVHIDSSNLSLHNQTKQSFISQEPETSLATDTSSNKPGKEAEEDEVLAGMNLVEINGSQKDVLLKDIAPQSRKRKRDSEEHEVISDMQPKTNLTQG